MQQAAYTRSYLSRKINVDIERGDLEAARQCTISGQPGSYEESVAQLASQ
jgi:hypothetical protein